MSQFAYVTDKTKFVDKSARKGLMTLEMFKKHLLMLDDKFENNQEELDNFIQDIMQQNRTTSIELKLEKMTQKDAKKGPSFAQIWEEFRALVPLYKRTNINGQSQIFFVDDNNEVSKIDNSVSSIGKLGIVIFPIISLFLVIKSILIISLSSLILLILFTKLVRLENMTINKLKKLFSSKKK